MFGYSNQIVRDLFDALSGLKFWKIFFIFEDNYTNESLFITTKLIVIIFVIIFVSNLHLYFNLL